MSLTVGNHLFCNRKGLASEHSHSSAEDLTNAIGELNEQVIILCREDIRADAPAAPLLDWSTFDKGEIAVQLKDTEGLADGCVTIKASSLQRIHPALLPIELETEWLFPISLKTVVLQVGAHLRQRPEERTNPVDSGFDTPIAQVAREDEGFFKLAKIGEPIETLIDGTAQTKRKIQEPVLTPADRPASPISRKSSPTGFAHFETPSRSGPVIPSLPQLPDPEAELRHAEGATPRIGTIAQNSLERIALERLREIFMTEEQLDARRVADLLAAFPRVNTAMVMLGEGTVLGGSLPEGYNLETALRAPVIMRSVREFDRKLRSNGTSAFTLLGDRPVTLFAEGNVYILISHEGRGLLPGVRQRIAEVASALDALCGRRAG
jgi:hypothetical protein